MNILVEHTVKLILTLVVGILSVCPSSHAEIPVNSSKMLALKEKGILVQAVYQYLQKVHEHQEDALKSKSDLEWIEVRVKRIEDRKNHVPGELRKAKQQVETRLSLISLDIPRLNALIERHLNTLRRLDERVKQANGNQPPAWWIFEDWIYGLMYPNRPNSPRSEAGIVLRNNGSMDSHGSAPKASSSALRNELEDKIKAVELDNWVSLNEIGNGLTLDVQLPILFGLGKSDVAKDYKPFFKKLAWLLNPYSVRVDVVGYTDGLAGSGSKLKPDMTLGAERAAHVVEELIDTGMTPGIFKIVGQSEYKADGLSPAMKRRVEVRVYFDPVRS